MNPRYYTSLHYRLAGMVGNLLHHYDNALFGLLVPFIAPLFFPHHDPLIALILTYGMLPLGVLTRPLGSLFFGRIGDRIGRKQALCFSLMGMSIVTMSFALLPGSEVIGGWSPLLLAFSRMLQNFFSGGESAGGAIFVLEHTEVSKRSLVSSFYDASSVIGILIASSAVTVLSSLNGVEEYWRVLFLGGGFTALLGIFLRVKAHDSREFTGTTPQRSSLFEVIGMHKSILCSLVLVSGFSYITYYLSFTLMNGFIPLVTSLTKADVMKVNTFLLVVDMSLLPFFGFLAFKWGKEKVMLVSAFLAAISAIPLFSCLDQAPFTTVIIVRLLIVIFGVAFSASYYAWALERVSPAYRYTILSLASALSSQFIGAPVSVFSLWLYKKTQWTGAPGIYLLVAGLSAGTVIFYFALKEKLLAKRT